MLVVGLLSALAAAGLNGAAGLLEAAGTRRARGTRALRQPLYLAGLGVDVAGFGLTVVALRHLPVFAVQAVLAGSIAVTVVAGTRLSGTRLRAVDRLAVAACITGLAVVAAGAGSGGAHPEPGTAGLVLLVAAALLAAAAVPAWRSGGAVPAAVVAGLAFGGVALAVRAVHLRTDVIDDLRTLPAEPSVYALVAFAVLGIAAYTRALARGDVGTVTGVLVVTETVVPGAVGVALLGDTVRPGWALPCVLGLLLAVGGVVVLVRSPVQRALTAAPGQVG
ncbi:MAG: hypothetical protein ACT4RN_16570 [Pseudonocardia sp.]